MLDKNYDNALDVLRDLSSEAKRGSLSNPVGRDKELKSIYGILSMEGKSNVMLLGPAGIGKTAIVEGIACDLAFGSIPPSVHIESVYELNLNSMMGDTSYRGQLEKKVSTLLSFFKSKPNALLFIEPISKCEYNLTNVLSHGILPS